MVKKVYVVEKLQVKPRWRILPCRDRNCDISTNKRYRPPMGCGIVACCYDHAERVYRRRNGKAPAVA